jgi:hypothetical protein
MLPIPHKQTNTPGARWCGHSWLRSAAKPSCQSSTCPVLCSNRAKHRAHLAGRCRHRRARARALPGVAHSPGSSRGDGAIFWSPDRTPSQGASVRRRGSRPQGRPRFPSPNSKGSRTPLLPPPAQFGAELSQSPGPLPRPHASVCAATAPCPRARGNSVQPENRGLAAGWRADSDLRAALRWCVGETRTNEANLKARARHRPRSRRSESLGTCPGTRMEDWVGAGCFFGPATQCNWCGIYNLPSGP